MADVGQQAPNFSLVAADGRQVALHDLLRQGPVVLVFYRGHWCPFCRRQLAKLQGNLERIRKRGASLVAVSIDERSLVRRLADELGLGFVLLSDPDSSAIDAYGVRNRLLGVKSGIPHPSVFIIDGQGIVRFREVRHNYRRRTTPHRMLRALDEVVGEQGAVSSL
ncbi:MAG: peroxiredoxin family protein [Planctomycetes bacterium]|nr:peroxiredoxin family protein [Planctomycetota bacterium]